MNYSQNTGLSNTSKSIEINISNEDYALLKQYSKTKFLSIEKLTSMIIARECLDLRIYDKMF